MSKSRESQDDPLGDTLKFLPLITYWVGWLSRSFAIGKWQSVYRGRGYEPLGLVPYRDFPNPASIDWPESFRLKKKTVRAYVEPKSIRIYLLGNLGPSMAFGSERTKRQRLALITALLAYAAHRAKDYFRFVGYTDEVELGFRKVHFDRDYPYAIARAILYFDWRGKKRGGLVRAALSLPPQKSLVVIASDHLGKLDGTEKAVQILSRQHHEILPIILWDPRELEFPQKIGLLPLKSLETQEEGDLLLDPFGITRRALERNVTEQKRRIEEIFHRYGLKPFFFTEADRSDLEDLISIFLAKRARL